MKLDELQRAAEQLSPDEQRKLIGFLVSLNIQRNENHREQLTERLNDRDPNNWISLKDVKRQF